jgi:hypothetical protein
MAIGSFDGAVKFDINYILDTISVRYDANSLTLGQIRKKVDRSSKVHSNRRTDSVARVR